ncbi:MAG: glycine C-acetyltransferase, partial [Planctomycetota bacterium]
MFGGMKQDLQRELGSIREAGLYKEERWILSPQAADIRVVYPQGNPPKEVINFCANNYLGLSSHPKVLAAAREALDSHGYGMSSVRFICGTQDIHKQLERRISEFLGTEDTILYAACFDANGGLFEPLLGAEDVIITDQLNHASIIDGIRLCKAKRLIYAHNDMAELEARLKEGRTARYRMIATDGAFSMDGGIAALDKICDLADKYDALVMVDDCHSTGFMGQTGRGSAEHCGVVGRVDVITSTLGKALGGASGGFTSGRKEIIELLRQRSRPYLFSNTLAPVIVKASLAVIDLLSESTALRDKLEANTKR